MPCDHLLYRNTRRHAPTCRDLLSCVMALCCCAPMTCAQGATAAPAARCAKLLSEVQPLVVPKLQVFHADDSHSDTLHAGEANYLDCDFRTGAPQGAQFDVGLHDAEERFRNAHAAGYAALPGFGDTARYTVGTAMGMQWVDVVRGKVACEARFAMDAGDIHGDWKEAAGKACEAALALH